MRCRAGTPIFKKNWVRFCCISNTQRHSFLSSLTSRRQTDAWKDRGDLKEKSQEKTHNTQCFYFLIYKLNLFLYLNGRKLSQQVRMLLKALELPPCFCRENHVCSLSVHVLSLHSEHMQTLRARAHTLFFRIYFDHQLCSVPVSSRLSLKDLSVWITELLALGDHFSEDFVIIVIVILHVISHAWYALPWLPGVVVSACFTQCSESEAQKEEGGKGTFVEGTVDFDNTCS